MPLFTDGPISSIDDLSAQDSQLLSVASVEGIDVTQKLALAQEELAMELHTLLMRFRYADQYFWLAPRLRLDAVVVTPPLKLWNTARALEMVYADAYNSQLNDRYAGKRDQFHALAKWGFEKLVQTGLGIAAQPLPRPAMPILAASPGTLPDGAYYVAMAWASSGGEEGAASVPNTINTASSTFSVQPGPAPDAATGWNVYAGTSPDAMIRQNASLLQPGQNWTAPSALTNTGKAPGDGQRPTYFQPIPRIIQRG
jgi:hypothetical protein